MCSFSIHFSTSLAWSVYIYCIIALSQSALQLAKLRLEKRWGWALAPLCLGELPSLSHLSCKLGVACSISDCAAQCGLHATRRTAQWPPSVLGKKEEKRWCIPEPRPRAPRSSLCRCVCRPRQSSKCTQKAKGSLEEKEELCTIKSYWYISRLGYTTHFVTLQPKSQYTVIHCLFCSCFFCHLNIPNWSYEVIRW